MAKRRGEPLSAEEKRPLNKESFKKLVGIFRFILPYKAYFIIGLSCLILSSSILLAFPYVTGKLIDAAQGQSNWYFNDVQSIALVLIGILAVQSVFSFLRVFLFAQVSERSMADVRQSLFAQLLSLPMPFYDQYRVGELTSRITNDVALLQDTFSITLAEFIRQIATLLVGIAIIAFITPKLTVFMLATFPVLVIVAMIFGRYIRKLSKKTQDKLAEANVIVEESLQSIHTVKSFTGERYESGRYRSALMEAVTIALRSSMFRGGFISFLIFVIFGGIVAVMWYGATLVAEGSMTVGDLLSFVLYTTFIGGSIAGLGDMYGQIQKAIGASERILQILAQPGESVNSGEASSLRMNGEITLSQLAFAYPSRPESIVLKNISMQVKAGEKVALVGHSGAGKSTIIQLLLRYYQPLAGNVLVDGQPIDDYELTAYRQNIGIVPQEILLFGGSIRENIAYGRPSATQEEIIAAAKKANAWQFISQFPEGLATLVGERGVKLSGGQRQRIAITRAILKDPAILVLDEATSSLDAESEHLVQEALDELMKGRTTIIIAHRLATIRKVDRIFVLSDGEIIQSGNHQELFSQKEGTYHSLVKLQLQDT
jgi:ABC-type multidrug transport system fused ATPase/permease subunit